MYLIISQKNNQTKYSQLWTNLKKDVHMFQKKVPSFTDADGVEWSGYEYIAVKK